MKQRLTPNYDHEKVDNPSLNDLIDVFEDAWKGYILVPAQVLLNTQYGDIAAMALLNPYFESIEALHRGSSSDGRSKEFFVAGFLRVFEKFLSTDDKMDVINAAKLIYKDVRNSIAHTGFASYQVHFQRKSQNAFVITYPLLSSGQPDKVRVESISINVQRIIFAVNQHLDRYVAELRQPQNTAVQNNFDSLMRSEWGIGKNGILIGMAEENIDNTI